jgi:hypothetical protein
LEIIQDDHHFFIRFHDFPRFLHFLAFRRRFRINDDVSELDLIFSMTDDDVQSLRFQLIGKLALIGIDTDNIRVSQISEHPCYA